MTNSMLLWWTLDSVPLAVVNNPKFVKGAAQWRSMLRAQVPSCVNQNEANWTYSAITSLLLNGTFAQERLTWRNFYHQLVTFLAFANHKRKRILTKGKVFALDQLSMHPPKFPQKPNFMVILMDGLRCQCKLFFTN